MSSCNIGTLRDKGCGDGSLVAMDTVYLFKQRVLCHVAFG